MSDIGPVTVKLPAGLPSLQGIPSLPQPQNNPATEGKFSDLFSNLIDSVNELHTDSAKAQDALMNGEPIELHDVMIKAEQAGLTTDLLLEIRNKLVNAYNEIIHMPM